MARRSGQAPAGGGAHEDPLARILGSVIVGPIKSRVRGVSTEVEVGPRDGVSQSSVVNLDNLQLLPRGRLVRRVGRAAPDTMRSICDAVAEAVGCR